MEAVVAPIIAAIEDGIANDGRWEMPWHNANAAAFGAYNPVTDREYTGGNRMVLALAVMFGRAEGHWATYRHWASLSKHTKTCEAAASNVGKRNESRPACGPDCHVVNVRKGAKATWLFRPRKFKKVDETTGEEKWIIGGFSPFPVFDSSDVDGYDMPKPEVPAIPADDASDIAAAFEFAANAGALVDEHWAAGASYSPGFDRITMPAKDRWKDSHGAWSTMAHELTHWTGHKTRLNRDLTGRFGGEAYAFEELIAEMGAAFTLAKIGRSAEPREDHAKYLASWLKVLRENPKHLWTAAGAAEKAAEFIVEAAATDEVMVAA